MHSIIGTSLIDHIKPGPKPYEIRDSRLNGFLLRVQPSGVMTYYIEFARARRMAIGRADAITPVMAREKAKT
ncbi:MAG: Arm DNA-binding domain-containing protein, partial [Alphaproteobacteria bacterium]